MRKIVCIILAVVALMAGTSLPAESFGGASRPKPKPKPLPPEPGKPALGIDIFGEQNFGGSPGQGGNEGKSGPAAKAREARAGDAIFCVAFPSAPQCQPVPRVAPQPPSAQQIVQTAQTSLTLPGSTPIIEPGPWRNKWKMVAVGYPLWLHVPGQTQMASSASVAGYTITLNAQRTALTFNMGDGTTKTCPTTTAWTQADAKKPSPTCGYTYRKKSLPKGTYLVTATSTWTITWTGAGQSGTFPMQQTGSTTLPVGELRSVLVPTQP